MNTFKRISKSYKKQNKEALEVFNRLWNDFINFEQTNSYDSAGYVFRQETIPLKIENVHKRWKHYVNKHNARPNSVKFKPMALKDKIDDYLKVKDKQVWVSYSRELGFKLYGFYASIQDYEDAYHHQKPPKRAVKELLYNQNPMLTINLSYHRMIGKYRKTVDFPESFSELSRRQFLSFIKLAGQNLTDYELKIRFLRKNFFRLPVTRIAALHKLSKKAKNKTFSQAYYEGWLDNSSVIHELVKKLSFLSESPVFVKNPVPRWRFYFGPADNLKNISIWEFAMAEKYFLLFAENQKTEDLNRFVGILMRPVSVMAFLKKIFSYSNDIRSFFHDELLSKYSANIAAMPEYKKLAVVAFFRSVRESFKMLFPNVYGDVESKRNNKDSEGNWGDVILSFSGDIPGNEEKVAAVNLYTFLYRIDKLIDDQKNKK